MSTTGTSSSASNLPAALLRAGAVCLIVLGAVTLRAQDERLGRGFDVLAFGSYTTTAKFFPFPDSPNESSRGSYETIDDIFGAGVSVEYHVGGQNVALGISAEYIRKNPPTGHLAGGEGFQFIPVELTAYLQIPLQSERIRLFMGGGGGVYRGARVFSGPNGIGEAGSSATAYGIHVVGGMDYFITDRLFLRGEMKFRDPEFNTEDRSDRYPAMHARINIDGITFVLAAGIAL